MGRNRRILLLLAALRLLGEKGRSYEDRENGRAQSQRIEARRTFSFVENMGICVFSCNRRLDDGALSICALAYRISPSRVSADCTVQPPAVEETGREMGSSN